MPVTTNPVYAFSTRLSTTRTWLPIDGIGASGTPTTGEDSAKFATLTVTNSGYLANDRATPIIFHIAIWKRSLLAANNTTLMGAANQMVFIRTKVSLTGNNDVFELKDLYIDKFVPNDSTPEDEPLVCIWIEATSGSGEENASLDVCLTR